MFVCTEIWSRTRKYWTSTKPSLKNSIRHFLRSLSLSNWNFSRISIIHTCFPRKQTVNQAKQKLTTPTLTLSGLGSARKASVTPRIGSLGAGSTLPHHDDIDLAAPPPELRRSTAFFRIIAFRSAMESQTLSLSLTLSKQVSKIEERVKKASERKKSQRSRSEKLDYKYKAIYIITKRRENVNERFDFNFFFFVFTNIFIYLFIWYWVLLLSK